MTGGEGGARKVKVRMSMPASSWRRGGEDA